ncbi:MAG TPA: glycosyltransferase family 39 protein, partial [Candidatus Kapabacteria bacterium]|nr:glycosyltransferase family 39 protein [Candidatus Kapabacteria bacterium]
MIRRIENALVAIACLIPFVRLGIGEIQPWDESLYVIRAEACLKFGAWLDQTKYAVGHLYSATHPPFGVWLIAIAKYLLGNSTFAARFPAALAASGSVLLLWLIVRKFASSEAALVSAISLATADLFVLLGQRTQMETSVLFFSLASVLALVTAIEQKQWIWWAVGSLLLALGLFTKFGVALFVSPLLILLPWTLGSPRSIRSVLLSFLVALVLVAPWFVMIESRHPDYWNHVATGLITLGEGKYDPSKLAWWYYLNRLAVGLPILILFPFVKRMNKFYITSIVWVLAVLVLLQLVGTRKAHFAFLLLAPGATLLGAAWDSIMERPAKWRAALFLGAVLAIAWSASEQVRLLLTHHLAWNDAIFPSVSIIIICIGVGLAAVALARIASHARYAVALSLLLLGLAFSHLLSEDARVFQDGAAKVASLATGLSSKSDMIVIHPDFPHEQYAPQLAYYTGGWTLGWIPNKTSRTITWDSAATPAYAPDTAREIAVIMNYTDRFNHPTPAKTALWNSLTKKLQRSFSHERVFRSF